MAPVLPITPLRPRAPPPTTPVLAPRWTVDLVPTGEPLVHVDATDGAEVIAVCGGDSQMRFRESVE